MHSKAICAYSRVSFYSRSSLKYVYKKHNLQKSKRFVHNSTSNNRSALSELKLNHNLWPTKSSSHSNALLSFSVLIVPYFISTPADISLDVLPALSVPFVDFLGILAILRSQIVFELSAKCNSISSNVRPSVSGSTLYVNINPMPQTMQ